jgi:hypothetical protein
MDKVKRDTAFDEFIGGLAYEDDGGWSKDVWDASWAEQQKEIDSIHACWSKDIWDAVWAEQQKEIDALRARIKLLEEEVAFVEHGYTRKPEGESK